MGLIRRLGLVISVLAGSALLALIGLMLAHPLAVSQTAWMAIDETHGTVSFEIRNWAPGSLVVDSLMFPLDKTRGVTFGTPTVTAPDGRQAPLVHYRVGSFSTVRVTIPANLSSGTELKELRLGYRLIGIPKYVWIDVPEM